MGGSDELMTRSRTVSCSRDDEMCGAVRAPDCNGIPCGAWDAVLHGLVARAVQPIRGGGGVVHAWPLLAREDSTNSPALRLISADMRRIMGLGRKALEDACDGVCRAASGGSEG